MAEAMDDGGVTETSTIPTYVFVQKQMEDLVKLQSQTILKLQEDISCHETTLLESNQSKQLYDAEIQALKRNLRENYVPKEQYAQVLDELETEKLEHLQTHGKLNEVSDRLEFALGEIEVLTKQLAREKASFEKAFGSLLQKSASESTKSAVLSSKCTEISKKVEEQEDQIDSKVEEIQKLEKKLKSQEMSYKKKLTEAEIQRKQEQYIAKLLENQNKIKNIESENKFKVPGRKSKKS